MRVDYDLGHGFTARRILHAKTCPVHQGHPLACGIIVSHLHNDGTLCDGFIPWCGHCAGQHIGLWKLISIDTLTITPPVHIRACDTYGEIIGGRWVPK